jgi:hypothetical protein
MESQLTETQQTMGYDQLEFYSEGRDKPLKHFKHGSHVQIYVAT